MNKRTIVLVLATAIVAVVAMCQSVAAAGVLESLDDPALGPGSITRDPISGLDWLDWSLSTNRSVSQVIVQTGVGGPFEGFRYATASEVIDLFLHAGFSEVDPYPGPKAIDYGAAVELVSLLGVTNTSSSTTQSRALLGPGNYALPGYTVEVLTYYNPTALTGAAGANGGFVGPVGVSQNANPSRGHALVREVPEPTTAVYLLAAALCLALWRRSLAQLIRTS
jgi:hypothetical protein